MGAGRNWTAGPEGRPVATPDDIDTPGVAKAEGVIELPLHVDWSPPFRRYDLDDPVDRVRVYEVVLREGTDADVRHFIRLEVLVELWDDLVLAHRVERAWLAWFARRGIPVTPHGHYLDVLARRQALWGPPPARYPEGERISRLDRSLPPTG
jgi:hypothetical protein